MDEELRKFIEAEAKKIALPAIISDEEELYVPKGLSTCLS